MMTLIARALVSGAIASVTASVALVSCAKRERRSPTRPLNATSHWLHGDAAALVPNVDLKHTAVGYGTHHAAAVLWAVLFEKLRTRSADRGLAAASRDALITSATAALVDYTVTPHRFTPGWEMVLSKQSMAAAYLAMAAGLILSEYVLPDRGRRRSQGGREQCVHLAPKGLT
jgi:hypothetical protein